MIASSFLNLYFVQLHNTNECEKQSVSFALSSTVQYTPASNRSAARLTARFIKLSLRLRTLFAPTQQLVLFSHNTK